MAGRGLAHVSLSADVCRMRVRRRGECLQRSDIALRNILSDDYQLFCIGVSLSDDNTSSRTSTHQEFHGKAASVSF